jgi:hypothetical protein
LCARIYTWCPIVVSGLEEDEGIGVGVERSSGIGRKLEYSWPAFVGAEADLMDFAGTEGRAPPAAEPLLGPEGFAFLVTLGMVQAIPIPRER